MALTQINGRNISQATDATISALRFLNTNGNAILTLPVGTTAQRPASPDDGTLRFNTTELGAEISERLHLDLVLEIGSLSLVVVLLLARIVLSEPMLILLMKT